MARYPGALRMTESKASTAAGMQRKAPLTRGAQNFISGTPPEAGGEGESRGEQPCQQKADASHAQGDGPALAQKSLYGLAEGVRRAEIAVHGAAQVAGVKAEDVVFSGARLAQGAHAFGIQAGIEFTFVGIEAGSQADQRRRKQSAEQDERGDGSQFSREACVRFSMPRFLRRIFCIEPTWRAS